MSNIGKNLEPVNTSPDQFGQVYDASKDLTDGNAPKGGNVALTNLLTFLQLHFNFTDNTT